MSAANVYGASIGPRGAAMVGACHDEAGVTVVEFTTYPPNLAGIGQAIELLPDEAAVFVDGGLHGADLWHYLGSPKPDRHLILFDAARPELRRAELVGRLRAAYEQHAFAILRDLPEVEALRTALAAATREDAHERVEVAALGLAVVDRRRKPRPPLFVGTA